MPRSLTLSLACGWASYLACCLACYLAASLIASLVDVGEDLSPPGGGGTAPLGDLAKGSQASAAKTRVGLHLAHRAAG